MPRTLKQIAADMDRYLRDLEARTQDREIELLRIFLEGERALFAERDSILVRLSTDAAGNLTKGNANLARIDTLIAQIDGTIQKALINPGFDWADNMALWAQDNGRALAEMNLNFHLIDQKAVRATFAHITAAEEGEDGRGWTGRWDISGGPGACRRPERRPALAERLGVGKRTRGEHPGGGRGA